MTGVVHTTPNAISKLKTTVVDDLLGGVNIVYYPPFSGESGVVNYQYKWGDIRRYGATDGADNTVAIQAAIDTGRAVDFAGLTSYANNLNQSADDQVFYSSLGVARIIKNANGDLFSGAGDRLFFELLSFRGDAATPVYTGHNIVLTGDHPVFNFCGSRWAYGRALKATGDHVQVNGTCDVWQTADASSSGYDMEIGVSGKATLYHELSGVYSSQNTGGILLIDTGSHTIKGGQFGKLTIQAGTSPAGVNGGKTSNARILNDVDVGLSDAVFSGNQFGALVNMTFASGTSGCSVDKTNVFSNGATVTNNGNVNNVIERNNSTGSVCKTLYGDDSSTATWSIDPLSPNAQFKYSGAIVLDNTRAFRGYQSDGSTLLNLARVNGSDDIEIGANNGAGSCSVNGGSGGVYFNTGAVSRWQVTGSSLRPHADNSYSLGDASQRASVIYAASGTINTSDKRDKQQVRVLNEAEKNVALKVKQLIRAFKYNDAVKVKGDQARVHFGVIAQSVKAAFESEGLSAEDYGVLCFDEWPEREEIELNGVVVQEYMPSGNRYGVRYDELIMFLLSVL